MKLKLLVLPILLACSVAGCNGSFGSSYSYNNDYSYSYGGNSNTTTYVSSEQKVINHLKSRGSGDYYMVVCRNTTSNDVNIYSTLGYKDGYFYVGNMATSGSLICSFTFMVKFNASSASGMFQIESNGTVYFKAYETIYFSNHLVNNISVSSVAVNKFSSSETENISKLNVGTLNTGVGDVNSYLSKNSLPYIY